MVQLLKYGADPALPPRRPFLLWSMQLGKPCLDWLVQAHASGRRQLDPMTAIVALQAALVQQHAAAYAALLPLVQRQHAEAALPQLEALRTLMQAARHGTVQQARDALVLGANPAAPGAAPACLLAQAAMHRRISQSEGLLTLLLEAGAQLRVEDVLKVIDREDPPALHRLLKIGKPQVCGRIAACCTVLALWQCGSVAVRAGAAAGGLPAAELAGKHRAASLPPALPPTCPPTCARLPARLPACPPSRPPACPPACTCIQVDPAVPTLRLQEGAIRGNGGEEGDDDEEEEDLQPGVISCPVLFNLERTAELLHMDCHFYRVGGRAGGRAGRWAGIRVGRRVVGCRVGEVVCWWVGGVCEIEILGVQIWVGPASNLQSTVGLPLPNPPPVCLPWPALPCPGLACRSALTLATARMS